MYDPGNQRLSTVAVLSPSFSRHCGQHDLRLTVLDRFGPCAKSSVVRATPLSAVGRALGQQVSAALRMASCCAAAGVRRGAGEVQGRCGSHQLLSGPLPAAAGRAPPDEAGELTRVTGAVAVALDSTHCCTEQLDHRHPCCHGGLNFGFADVAAALLPATARRALHASNQRTDMHWRTMHVPWT